MKRVRRLGVPSALGLSLAAGAIATGPSCGDAAAPPGIAASSTPGAGGADTGALDGLETSAEPDVGADTDTGSDITPDWTAMGDVVQCPMERMTNAESVRLFSWMPCEGASQCDFMAFAPWLGALNTDFIFITGSTGQEAGQGYFAMSIHSWEGSTVFFAKEDGSLVEAYRAGNQQGGCDLADGSIGPVDHGALITKYLDATPAAVTGGLVHIFGSKSPPKTFDVGTVLGYGPYPNRMSATRWLWGYPEKYLSVSASDGSDLQKPASISLDLKGTLALAYAPTSTGKSFLFGEQVSPDGVQVNSLIAQTDGVAAPTPYLVPQDSSFFGEVRYADTHVAWFRGISPQGDAYQAVELWASPFDEDPAKLEPYKVDDFAGKYIPEGYTVGGNGKVAVPVAVQNSLTGISIWNLATKQRSTITLPDMRTVSGLLGLTKTHLWVSGVTANNVVDSVFRFAL